MTVAGFVASAALSGAASVGAEALVDKLTDWNREWKPPSNEVQAAALDAYHQAVAETAWETIRELVDEERDTEDERERLRKLYERARNVGDDGLEPLLAPKRVESHLDDGPVTAGEAIVEATAELVDSEAFQEMIRADLEEVIAAEFLRRCHEDDVLMTAYQIDSNNKLASKLDELPGALQQRLVEARRRRAQRRVREKLRTRRKSREPDAGNPNALLRPSYQLTDYVDVGGIADEIGGWLDADVDFSWYVVSGGGGSGKTRLAIELIGDSQRKGWDAGFVEAPDLDSILKRVDEDWIPAAPTLLVLDYAAARVDRVARLLRSLHDRAQTGEASLRLLLLERHANRDEGWLEELDLQPGDEVGDAIRENLGGLVNLDERQRAYDAEWGRRLLDQTINGYNRLEGSEPVEPLELSDEETGALLERTERRPLYVILAGLGYCWSGNPDTLRRSPAALVEAAVGRQMEFFRKHSRWRDENVSSRQRDVLLLALVAFTLLGEPEDREKKALELLEVLLDVSRTNLSTGDVQSLLAPVVAGGQSQGVFPQPLGPDLVAGPFCYRVLSEKTGSFPGLSPPDIVGWILRQDSQPALIRIARTLHDLGGEGASESSNLEGARRATWLDQAGERFADWIEEALQDTDKSELEALLRALPHQGVGLDGLKAEASRVLVKKAEDPSEIAQFSTTYARALSRLGDWETAVQIAETVKESVSDRSEVENEEELLGLARLFSDLGVHSANVGQLKQARDYEKEAKEILEDAVSGVSASQQKMLAATLHNLSEYSHQLGDTEKAVQLAERAVCIRQEFMKRNPDEFKERVARSHHAWGNAMFRNGNVDGAREALEIAVEIRRSLAGEDPSRTHPGLAASLNTLGAIQTENGDPEKGLENLREAVEARRELLDRNHSRFLPDFAGSLRNLGSCYIELDQPSQGLEVLESAEGFYEQLAKEHPMRFADDHARAKAEVARALKSQGAYREAAVTLIESLETLSPYFWEDDPPEPVRKLAEVILDRYQETVEETDFDFEAAGIKPFPREIRNGVWPDASQD